MPKFALDADERVFCLGSCFARNIEEHLILNDIEVLSKRLNCPIEEWSARPNGIVNKFTTHSILNEIENLEIGSADIGEQHFCEVPDGWVDLQLTPHATPVTLERAIERRRYLIDEYFARLRDATVVIITLGLNEVWRDETTGLYLNKPPPLAIARRSEGRYALYITDADENHAVLEEICTRLMAFNRNLKIVLTVSPVPMESTFSGRDVAIANTLSKATLRAAAQALVDSHDAVDYFPSFEMITQAPKHEAYAEDLRHVRNAAVGGVVQTFLANYLGREAPVNVEFTEIAYLAANPDVDQLVRAGALGSAYEHWKTQGEAEGRPLKPEGGPTDLMRTTGAY